MATASKKITIKSPNSNQPKVIKTSAGDISTVRAGQNEKISYTVEYMTANLKKGQLIAEALSSAMKKAQSNNK